MNTILVGIDGSPAATQALTRAIELAQATGASLAFVCVTRPHRQEAAARRASESDRRTAELAAIVARAVGVPATTHSASGAPADALARLADELDADLIVVGSRGLGSVRGAVLGSVALALLRRARTPVLVVKTRRLHEHAAA
jgi:nucleotide-binding universal stress UspA family protein